MSGSSVAGSSVAGGDEDENKEKDNLDKFLANHTSEDNESFSELQEEAFKAHRLHTSASLKHAYLLIQNCDI